ncbi:MAG: ABC transporter ATP-binding protein [Blautia sp.]
MGSNGVGKTTLLKCMMGLLKWNSGHSYVDDQEISQMKHKDFWQKIAYVPQAKGAAFGYSALDMVTLGRSAHLGTFAQPGKEDRKAAEEAMEEIGITYLRDKLCTEMSGGELQMVLIARALTIAPSMLVLDEPESNPGFQKSADHSGNNPKTLKNRGISAIVNTHYPEHALKISDKALLLNQDGTNVFGNADEVINVENMRHSFSVQVHINQFSVDGRDYRSVVPLHLVRYLHENDHSGRRSCLRKNFRDFENSRTPLKGKLPGRSHESWTVFPVKMTGSAGLQESQMSNTFPEIPVRITILLDSISDIFQWGLSEDLDLLITEKRRSLRRDVRLISGIFRQSVSLTAFPASPLRRKSVRCSAMRISLP